jgi:phosphate-selective porin OprO and OprP
MRIRTPRELAITLAILLVTRSSVTAQQVVSGSAASSTATEIERAAPAEAAGADVSLEMLIAQLESLDQQVRILQRKLELDREQAAAVAKTAPVTSIGREGFSFKSDDGQFQLRLRGYVHSDARLIGGTGAAPDTFVLRRVRPIVEATVFRLFDVRLMPDFGDGRTVLQDAYVESRFTPWLRIRTGKYKAPVGLERLTSATELAFVERALPTALAPNRDVGVSVLGEVLGDRLSYAAGVFNGVVDGSSADIDDRPGKDFVGRVFTHPFRAAKDSPFKGLGFGIAASLGTQDGGAVTPNLPQYRTAAQQVFFRYRTDVSPDLTTIASGRHVRISPQGYYYTGPFGVLGEFIHSTQDVRVGAAESKIGASAWQVSTVWVVTGEDASYRSAAPRKVFDSRAGTWGAFELAARYNELTVDAEAFPVFANPDASARRARSWGVGANWYLNRGVKFMVNYDQTSFDGGAPAGGDRATEHSVLTRAQLGF